MKKILIVLSIGLLTSCIHSNKFTVTGTIDGGVGEIIYLEHNGLTKNTLLDSTRIKKNNTFRFRAKKPQYPDFYRLRLGSKQIHFAVDSTETIEINASFDSFSTDYTITGSESNTDIQTLRKSIGKVQQKANQIVKGLSYAERNNLINELTFLLEEHKNLAKPIILKNPRSTAAYYAIFQQVSNVYVFTPYDKEDRAYCAAVATSYNTYMPNYDRSKNLYALVMDAIKSERQAQQQAAWREIIEQSGVGFIDIELPDHNEQMRKLSDLSGKVVLLDFSTYDSQGSISYTFALRELYDQYASKGFEIYQVSLDRNKFVWEDAVENLPWICVRDENGPNTRYVSTYNISSIPSYFLIDRSGDIVGRNIDINTLRKEIEKRL